MKRTPRTNAGNSTLDWPALHEAADRLVAAVAPMIPARSRSVEIRRRVGSLRTFAGNMRINRKRLREGNEAIRPLFYIWTMLNACNFACGYCDNHRGEKYPDLPNRGALDTARGKDLLRIMRTGTSALYFCGGEPTLRPDLPALTEEAQRLNYWPLMINTNGSRFHHLLLQPAWAEWLSHIDVIIVSLDSLDPNVLAEMYDYPHPEEVIINILALAKLSKIAGFKLFLNAVIQPGRVDDARDVLRFCEELDSWFAFAPMNDAAGLSDELACDPAYTALANDLIERSRRGAKMVGAPELLQRVLFGEPLDCLPTAFSHVSPEGKVEWPCKPSVNVPSAHVPVLEHATLDDVWGKGRSLIDPTNFHGSGPSQCGGECNWMQHYVADAFLRLMRDPLKQRWVASSLWRFLTKR